MNLTLIAFTHYGDGKVTEKNFFFNFFLFRSMYKSIQKKMQYTLKAQDYIRTTGLGLTLRNKKSCISRLKIKKEN